MAEKNFAKRYYRYKNNLLSIEDELEFKQGLQYDKYNRYAADGLSYITEEEYDQGFNHFVEFIELNKKSIKKKRKVRWILYLTAIAASIALILFLNLFEGNIPDVRIVEQNDYASSEKMNAIDKDKEIIKNSNCSNFTEPEGYDIYIKENLRYPENHKELYISGIIILSIQLKVDGSIEDVKVISSPDKDIGIKAIKVVMEGPHWISTQKDGKPEKNTVYKEIYFNNAL